MILAKTISQCSFAARHADGFAPRSFDNATRSLPQTGPNSLYLDAYREGERIPSANEIIEAGPGGIITDRVESFKDFDGPIWWTDAFVPSIIQLAAAHRSLFNLKSIAITGSVGKSTTTQLLANALGGDVLATVGNDNDEYGVPALCLNLTDAHRFLVCEMGTWRPGEIADCSSAAMPSVGIVTNVGESHLSRFGSVVAIAHAKKELFDSLPADGYAIANRDDPWCDELLRNVEARHLTFSMRPSGANATVERAEFHASGTTVDANVLGHRLSFRLRTPGKHMVRNALAALVAMATCDADLDLCASRMSDFDALPARLRFVPTAEHTVIDDTFNASVASVEALSEVLLLSSKRRVVVFGGIAELGDSAAQRNLEALQLLSDASDVMLAYGSILEPLTEVFEATAPHTLFVKTEADLQRELTRLVEKDDLVAFKGSRASGLSSAVAMWTRSNAERTRENSDARHP